MIYKYPEYISEIGKKHQLNRNKGRQLYATYLVTDDGKDILDIRVWKDGNPTLIGVFIYESMANRLLLCLQEFIKLHEEKESKRIENILGYDPFSEE